MYIKKKITGEVGKYFCEAHWDREFNKLSIRIYDKDPDRTIWGVPINVNPIIHRTYRLVESESDIDNVEAAMKYIISLIKEWELPLLQKRVLEKWNGHIHEEDPNDPWIPGTESIREGPARIYIMGERVQ